MSALLWKALAKQAAQMGLTVAGKRVLDVGRKVYALKMAAGLSHQDAAQEAIQAMKSYVAGQCKTAGGNACAATRRAAAKAIEAFRAWAENVRR